MIDDVDTNAGRTGQEKPIDTGDNKETSVAVLQGSKLGPIPTMLCLTRRDEATDAQNPLDASGDYPLICEVQFGIGNASERVQFDWLNGVMVALPTGNVGAVRCISPAISGVAPLKQFVGAMISPAHMTSCGPLPQARLTERPRNVVNTATTAVYRVPPRAHAVRLFTTAPEFAGSYTVNVLSAIDAGKTATYAVRPDGFEEIPLGAGARAVTVTNNAGRTVDVVIQWSISL